MSDSVVDLVNMMTGQHLRDVSELQLNEKIRTVRQLIKSPFDFDKVKSDFVKKRKTRQSNRSVYEAVCKVDFECFNENIDWEGTNELSGLIDMKVALFYESYGSGMLEMGYVVMSFMN